MPNTLGKTDICNIALRRIGVRPVNNVESDPDNAAVEMKAQWANAVLNVLREAEWNFAKKIQPLALLADEQILGWRFLYRYPADCAMFWKVESPVSSYVHEFEHKWEAMISPETNTPVIATNVEGAYGRYTAQVEDVTRWDPNFVDCLAWRLAYEACPRLSSDSQQLQVCARGYAMSLSHAMTMNRVERKNDHEQFGFFINVR